MRCWFAVCVREWGRGLLCVYLFFSLFVSLFLSIVGSFSYCRMYTIHFNKTLLFEITKVCVWVCVIAC
jgi:hypothetical protein